MSRAGVGKPPARVSHLVDSEARESLILRVQNPAAPILRLLELTEDPRTTYSCIFQWEERLSSFLKVVFEPK